MILDSVTRRVSLRLISILSASVTRARYLAGISSIGLLMAAGIAHAAAPTELEAALVPLPPALSPAYRLIRPLRVVWAHRGEACRLLRGLTPWTR